MQCHSSCHRSCARPRSPTACVSPGNVAKSKRVQNLARTSHPSTRTRHIRHTSMVFTAGPTTESAPVDDCARSRPPTACASPRNADKIKSVQNIHVRHAHLLERVTSSWGDWLKMSSVGGNWLKMSSVHDSWLRISSIHSAPLGHFREFYKGRTPHLRRARVRPRASTR